MNSFGARGALAAGGPEIFRLNVLEKSGVGPVSRLPFAMKILLENLLRQEDGRFVTADDIARLANWDPKSSEAREIAFTPARVLLQDFTGVPAIADLAAMRDAVRARGGDPTVINPLQPVELVIDHSVQVDRFASAGAFAYNADLEFHRNRERYLFLRWGQGALRNFRVVPPDTGIVHQVNLEYLARVVVAEKRDGRLLAFPDTLVGTDSHTPMVNGLGVMGWGVGGIEAEAAMLGQPISMLLPAVLGVRLLNRLPAGTTATDLVLTVTEALRKKGVVGKFVEFFGAGVAALTVADRATLGNMSPEYGATIAISPIDEATLHYLRFTHRDAERVELVERYAKEQGLFGAGTPASSYTDVLDFDLATVEPSLAGPKRPQDRVPLSQAKTGFAQALPAMLPAGADGTAANGNGLHHGSVVIAAITSCTNTSNPSVLMAAGLLAKKAVERGLKSQPWVKTSLAPGSKVVTDYLERAGLTPYLEQLGFYLVGYGCTTCIGNSGPLPDEVAEAVAQNHLVVAAVLSGNRNFEGRIHPQVRANYLASPPLVVAYALAGDMNRDLTREPLGTGKDGQPVYLKDVWPSPQEVAETVERCVTPEMFEREYADVFAGDQNWKGLQVIPGELYAWEPDSTYIKKPPFFEGVATAPSAIRGARVLALLGDSVTTDHISPAGSIGAKSPAGEYLIAHGVAPGDFNSYGARRGNHEVMVRGTFANVRLRNKLAPGTEGGFTRHFCRQLEDVPSASGRPQAGTEARTPSDHRERPKQEVASHPEGEGMTIFAASERYAQEGVPCLVIAGAEYGSGSSRDWAAKGPRLLGVQAVIAVSFERIHRSNLIGMGILPLQFLQGETAESLGLTGEESYDLLGLDQLQPGGRLEVTATAPGGQRRAFTATVRLDTPMELAYYRDGGILPYVLNQLMARGGGAASQLPT
ncbi:MAG TPA: aconitate hydratase AcnA [Terriglobales bacterium]|nr:aconitate hydratase AcnA [Terriglobales bacterium]